MIAVDHMMFEVCGRVSRWLRYWRNLTRRYSAYGAENDELKEHCSGREVIRLYGDRVVDFVVVEMYFRFSMFSIEQLR
jgi:hypothetical protein